MSDVPTVEIQPLELTIHRGDLMLVTGREGWISGGRTGLFAHDTRYLSTYALTIEEFRPTLLTAQQTIHNAVLLTYTNPTFEVYRQKVDAQALLITLTRLIEDDLREAIEITNFAREPLRFRMQINLECGFEDLFELRGYPTPPRVIQFGYDGRHTVDFTYRNGTFTRHLAYRIVSADSQPRYSPNLLIFPIELQPQQTWQAEVRVRVSATPAGPAGHVAHPSRRAVIAPQEIGRPGERLAHALEREQAGVEQWMAALPRLTTPNRIVQRAYEQALRDLASLRLQRAGQEWFPAAGVPWFNAIFGRDALITALQGLAFGLPFPSAVLTRLAELQGSQVDPRTDEEPGKIAHELRVGELTVTGKLPYTPYYGTVDAPLLFVILLAETYRFRGDRDLLARFIEPAEACLRWAAGYGDIDGDGFIEYWMRSPEDYHNQAWKDAGDAVVYPGGEIVPTPIAIVELQGLYYAALRSAATIYRALGRPAEAEAAERHADRLYAAFNERYWLPEAQFYAYGLDPDKRPIRTVASNPGQLLWTGIVPPERAGLVAQRLMADDLWCGWGVRTLSRHNGAYAPVMYQRGSIWPHDNALIAFGLQRYGRWREANRIAEGIFAASGFFAHGQLPELWAGLDRGATRWPVLYPAANVPQAWAAGAVLLLLRTLLGLEPDIERRRLLIRPALPAWLEALTLRGIPFAGGSVDLHLWGSGSDTRVEVLRTTGEITVEAQPAAKEGA